MLQHKTYLILSSEFLFWNQNSIAKMFWIIFQNPNEIQDALTHALFENWLGIIISKP